MHFSHQPNDSISSCCDAVAHMLRGQTQIDSINHFGIFKLNSPNWMKILNGTFHHDTYSSAIHFPPNFPQLQVSASANLISLWLSVWLPLNKAVENLSKHDRMYDRRGNDHLMRWIRSLLPFILRLLNDALLLQCDTKYAETIWPACNSAQNCWHANMCRGTLHDAFCVWLCWTCEIATDRMEK